MKKAHIATGGTIVVIAALAVSHFSPQKPVKQPVELTKVTSTTEAVKTPVKPVSSPITIHFDGCKMSGALPDPNCTPGVDNPDVTDATKDSNICMHGWSTKSIRPPVSYTNPLKTKLMAKYGFTDSPSNYELDHLVALTDGGNPTDEMNLWPEPKHVMVNGVDMGFPTKDKVEVYIHKQICDGNLSLTTGRNILKTDWTQGYDMMIHDTNYKAPSFGVSE